MADSESNTNNFHDSDTKCKDEGIIISTETFESSTPTESLQKRQQPCEVEIESEKIKSEQNEIPKTEFPMKEHVNESEPQEVNPSAVLNTIGIGLCDIGKNVGLPVRENVSMEVDQLLRYSPQQDYTFNNSIHITGSWKEFKRKDGISMKGCKWSPDGTCVLTNSDDNILRVFDLPPELHCQESWQKGKTLPELKPALCVVEGDIIYDYCWYPLMSSWNPLSCCLVSTSKDSPIHLWDAFTGELRCTYRAYNAVDEIEAAYSVAFNPSGEKLYCGFKNIVRVFNTNLPGRHCETRNLKRNNLSQRQTGIISCITVNPVMPDIYVVGSYSRSIDTSGYNLQQWQDSEGEQMPLQGVYSEPNGTLLCLLLGHSKGITHLQFSRDGTKLLSGGRKDSEMICWDIRNPGTVLFTAQRDVTTNQRMYFDITPDSRYVVSGNTNGFVSTWDMLEVSKSTMEEPVLSPCSTFSAHQDCVNGISIHQQYPILATASGQRHVTCSELETSYNEYDTSLKLWWFGKVV